MQALALAAVVALAAAAPTIDLRTASAAAARPASAGLALPPPPTRWVEDTAGFMTPAARQALDQRLEAYQRATGHQVIVWIGRTIGDAALDDWAVRTFAAWKVGSAKLDDGIVMFVLTEDRKIDIEVGYGLEGPVPDAVASRIIREVMAPKLRAGNPDAAITEGADALLTAIEGKPWVGGGAAAPAPAPEQGRSLSSYVIGGIALIGFLILMMINPRLAMLLLWSMASSRGGGSPGGGGFGGFSGGGGRSGGGGARGGW